ncbi:MAG: HAMP domain-containing sensor histidine kinase [Candidatus Eremiobacteraeota bacterium]|nr:HAMP domain-containing sensor histidine kinase [Candidatus Eremiobacteraeota bacterium]
MENRTIPTSFAPAERLKGEALQKQVDEIKKNSLIKQILDIVPGFTVILNECRQIVFINKPFLDFLGIKEEKQALGLRPGEVFTCAHSDESEGGCGTTEFCQVCGAVGTILTSQQGQECRSECQIMMKSGDALDLNVSGAPFEVQGQKFTFFSVLDASAEKRRKNMERIFFHDVLNTTGGLYGYADLLCESLPESGETKNFATLIFNLTGNVIEEIESQKSISAAENMELIIKKEEADSLDVIKEIADLYKSHIVAHNKHIIIAPDSEAVKFQTDRLLIKRVLGNMVKNALEASKESQKVVILCYLNSNRIVFKVHNDGYIPRDAQLQIFKRSFSTKGKGRGLGTFSIKLLTERYLRGKASFKTSEFEGTDFVVEFPLDF